MRMPFFATPSSCNGSDMARWEETEGSGALLGRVVPQEDTPRERCSLEIPRLLSALPSYAFSADDGLERNASLGPR